MIPNEASWREDSDEKVQPVSTEGNASLVRELVDRLLGGGLYTRTALLLLPHKWLGREAEVAARLGIGYINYQDWKSKELTEAHTFLLYSSERLLNEIDDLCSRNQPYSAVLLSSLDLPLSSLNLQHRHTFWEFLFAAFNKRPRALILALPEEAVDALPKGSALDIWKSTGRLVRWSD